MAKLTATEERFIQNIAQGQNATQALLKSDKTESLDKSYFAVANKASRMLKKENIRQRLDEVLEQQGLSLDRPIRAINEALDSERIIPLGGAGETITAPDHQTRLKAAEQALKLHGAYDQDPQVQINQQVNINAIDPRVARFVLLYGRYPSDNELAGIGECDEASQADDVSIIDT